jgi:hypothetical protein
MQLSNLRHPIAVLVFVTVAFSGCSNGASSDTQDEIAKLEERLREEIADRERVQECKLEHSQRTYEAGERWREALVGDSCEVEGFAER